MNGNSILSATARADGSTAIEARTSTETRFLDRPGGRLAYEVSGEGPLVVCAPGMGDLRSVYRALAPQLVEAGFRVATMDLRGHGDSDPTFDRYDSVATGTDLLALADALGGSAVLIGNSMSAGGAAWAAAEQPSLVRGLVLIAPFVRNPPTSIVATIAMRIGLVRPWGIAAWRSYYAKLYRGQTPLDLQGHIAAIGASLAEPGRWTAFVRTTRTSHAPVEARLSEVAARSLIVMGTADPDWKDATLEARWVAKALNGETLLVPGAGHYPQSESPEFVGPAIIKFIGGLSPEAPRDGRA